MVQDFLTQQYPTVEQTIVNNATCLEKQKRGLLAELRSLIGSVCCVLIGVAYLRDVSFFPLVLRLITQMSLSVPSKQIPHLMLSETDRQEQRMFLLTGVVVSGLFSIISHILYAPYTSSKMGDHMLHGGVTVQFIGERVPAGRWELLVFDVLIFCIQYIYFCVMWATDDLAVVQSRAVSVLSDEVSSNNDALSDGFDGNVFLLTIDLWGSLQYTLKRALPDYVRGDSLSSSGASQESLSRTSHFLLRNLV